MFEVSDSGMEEADVYTRVWKEMKNWFEKHGHQLETIDRYSDWKDIDYIIIHNGMHEKWTRIFLRQGLLNELIYRASEPEAVNPLHSPKHIHKLLRYYKYIITWNPELTDEKRIFHMNTFPYVFVEQFGNMTFQERKLMVAIYSNKTSTNKNELYSERRKIINYFEQMDGQFDLYGYGWEKEGYRNYKGTVGQKSDIYHKYRFALAFENIKDTIGGVSEKIFDCICAGVVPIYYGSKTIHEIVPENVFIDYRKFQNLEELYYFLKNMDERTYLEYLESARAYLNSDLIKKAGIEGFCERLEYLMKENPAEDILCSKPEQLKYTAVSLIKEFKINAKQNLVKVRDYVKGYKK